MIVGDQAERARAYKKSTGDKHIMPGPVLSWGFKDSYLEGTISIITVLL
jgi:hypothetical protein